MDKVIEIENFLTPEYCFEIIKKFDEYKHKIEDYRDNRQILSIDFIIPHDLILKKVCYSITRAVQDVMNNPYLIPDYQQLVRWNVGSFCEGHKDYPHQLSSSILYLNEEYEGGETVIENLRVIPKTGKLIIFEGVKTEHKVNEVISGVRFVIPSWHI